MEDETIQKEGELAGIPMTPNSKSRHIVVFEKSGEKSIKTGLLYEENEFVICVTIVF